MDWGGGGGIKWSVRQVRQLQRHLLAGCKIGACPQPLNIGAHLAGAGSGTGRWAPPAAASPPPCTRHGCPRHRQFQPLFTSSFALRSGFCSATFPVLPPIFQCLPSICILVLHHYVYPPSPNVHPPPWDDGSPPPPRGGGGLTPDDGSPHPRGGRTPHNSHLNSSTSN